MQAPARPEIPRGPVVAGGLAIAVAIGSTQTWAHVLIVSLAGTDADRGMVTLVAALIAAAACAWCAFFGLRRVWYLLIGVVVGIVVTAMPIWFLADIVNETDDETFGNIIAPAWGLFFTIIAAIGFDLAILWQAANPPRRGRPIPFGGDLV